MILPMSIGSVRAVTLKDGGRAWRVRWTSAEGKQREKRLRGSKANANRFLAQRLEETAASAVGLSDHLSQTIPLADLAEDYIRHQADVLKPKGWKEMSVDLRRVVEQLGVLRVCEVTIPVVIALRERMPGSNRTRNLRIGYMRSMMRWAVHHGKIKMDPLAGLRRLPERGHEQKRRHALSPDEVSRLLDAAHELDQESRVRGPVPQTPILKVLIWTGLRMEEAASLEWRDMRDGSLYVRRTLKNNDPRRVPLLPSLLETLRGIRREQGEWIGRLPGEEDRILLGPRGGVIVPGAYGPVRRFLYAALERAEIDRHRSDGTSVDLHAMRHTCCCLLRDRGVDMGTASAILGHRSLDMVKRVYGRDDRAPLAEALQALTEVEGRLKGAKAKGARKA